MVQKQKVTDMFKIVLKTYQFASFLNLRYCFGCTKTERDEGLTWVSWRD